MKQYPSILSSNGTNFTEFDAYVFDKLDGSNLRFEYSPKSGWNKFGTRHRLFDETDEVFGQAIEIFNNNLNEPLTKILRDNRYNNNVVTVYCEFLGPNSFAGQHISSEKKQLFLFDVDIYKKGLLGPRDFLKLFGSLNIPKFLGIYRWNRDFIQKVRNFEIDGITFEGVVGKSGNGKNHDLIFRKIKTQKWIDEVRKRYSPELAEKLIIS